MNRIVLKRVFLAAVCCFLATGAVSADGLFGRRYHRKVVSVKSKTLQIKKSTVNTPESNVPAADPFAGLGEPEASAAEESAVSLEVAPCSDGPGIAKETTEAANAAPAEAKHEAIEKISLTAAAAVKAESRSVAKTDFRSLRKEIKSIYRENKKAGVSDRKIIEIILAIFLPPVAVYVHEGKINGKFWLNILLTLLFIVPGQIHALLVVCDVV